MAEEPDLFLFEEQERTFKTILSPGNSLPVIYSFFFLFITNRAPFPPLHHSEIKCST